MIEWIVSSGILIAAILLLRLVFKDRISKRLQYSLWALVALRLLIPGSIAQSTVSVGNLFSSLTEKPVVQAASGDLAPEVSYDLAVQEILSEHEYSADIYASLSQDRQESIVREYEPEILAKLDTYDKAYDIAQILKALWMTGSAALGLYLLGSNLYFFAKLKRSRRKLALATTLPVYRSSSIQMPFLFGFPTPAIYLPDTTVDEKSLAYILAHEQTHYRHLDHIWAMIRCICLAVHWYNPLVWIAVKVSRTDCELACDEGTLEKLGADQRESYGRVLIEMSCTKPSVQDYLLTATMTGDKKILFQRIRAIAKRPRFMLTAVISLAVAALAVIGCTFTGAKGSGPSTGADHPAQTTPPTETTVPTVPPTTLPSVTIPPTENQPRDFPLGSTGEITDGALRSLRVGMSPACDAYPFGENILLCNPQSGIYQIRSSQDGSILASATDANHANGITVTDSQIIYYSAISHKIIFRNRDLEVIKVLDFSLNDTTDEMLFSRDGKKAYYCEYPQTLVVLDLETMEQQMVQVSGPPIWALSGLYFEDTILRYWGRESGDDYYAFINLADVSYLGKDTTITKLQTWDHNYYLSRAYQGTAERLVVLDGAHRYMVPKEHGKKNNYTTVLPRLNSFFTLSYDYDSPEVILDLYDLDTKKRTSSLTVTLSGEYGSSAEVFSDISGEYIWLSLKTGNHYDGYEMVLYRWDFGANAIEDTILYCYDG